MASILLLAEHDQNQLAKSTANVLNCCQQIDDQSIDILVTGAGCKKIAEEAAQFPGVRTVLLAEAEQYQHGLAEPIADLVAAVIKERKYTHALVSATTFGKNCLPRIAALLDVQPLSDISAVKSENTFERPFYAGNCIATVEMLDAIKLATVRTTAFDASPSSGGQAEIVTLPPADSTTPPKSRYLSEQVTESERPELTAADIIISGGRGMQDGKNFKMLEAVADKLGAAIGASRAAVDSGFVPNDMQVGQTGKVVAPNLYIAVGISGAIQHLAGMKDSKVIVAINKDAEAPIFQVADYGLVADLFTAIPEFEKLV
ncbi:MAG: electron transfer flavoprotein subunit alpha/FixB family protein [Gammaproteobacteria bacterium]